MYGVSCLNYQTRATNNVQMSYPARDSCQLRKTQNNCIIIVHIKSTLYPLKWILHSKTISCRKLHLDILFEPMLFIFFKNVCTSSGRISGPKMQLRLPVFVAPIASIQGSNGQYSRLQGQHFRLQGQYSKLHAHYFSSRGSTLAPQAEF